MDHPNKKILIATGIFPPDIGGPATYASTLLAELPKRGFELRIVTYAESPVSNKEENNRLISISRKQGVISRYLKFFFAVYRLLRWADIAYLMGPVSEGFPAMLACILRGKKYYLKVVGDYAWEQFQQNAEGKMKNAEGEFVSPENFQRQKVLGLKIEVIRRLSNASLPGTPSE